MSSERSGVLRAMVTKFEDKSLLIFVALIVFFALLSMQYVFHKKNISIEDNTFVMAIIIYIVFMLYGLKADGFIRESKFKKNELYIAYFYFTCLISLTVSVFIILRYMNFVKLPSTIIPYAVVLLALIPLEIGIFKKAMTFIMNKK